MRKSKVFALFMAIIMACCLCFALSACVEKEHTHDWDTGWSSDEQSHWHKCKGCSETKDKANHTYTDGVCVCGKTEGKDDGEEQPPAVVALSYKLSEDGSYAICTGFSEDGEQGANVVVESEYEGKPVKEIGEKAFTGNKVIKKVVLPNSIEIINNRAFYTSSLEEINLPASMKSIGDYAFYKTLITDITFPNGLKSIGLAAFTYSSIKNVAIPDSVTELGAQVFWACSELTTAKVGNGVTELKDYAFYECGKLSSFTLPEKVTSLGKYSMARTSIKEITVPSSVTKIVTGAFYECEKLQKVDIQCENVGETMFKNCTSLESVNLSDKVKTIGTSAFDSCSYLQTVTGVNNLTTIGNSAFKNCTAMYDMSLPISVTSVGSAAFTGCYGLTLWVESATLISGIPTGVTNYSVVLDCKNNKRARDYKEYFVQNDIKYSLAFNTNGTAKENFVRIIRGQRGLASEIEIPDTVNYDGTSYPVQYVEDYAFMKKGNITKLQIGNNVDTIGVQAFENCNNIENIVFGNNVKTIKKNAFSGCKSLTKLNLPESLEKMEDWSFRYTGITRIFITKNVTSMFSGTFHPFSDCKSVDTIEVDSENPVFQSVNNYLISKPGKWLHIACKNSGEIPSNMGITQISNYAFAGIETLTSVTIPEGVTTINNGAFNDCINLSKVDIPSTVTTLKESAFSNTGLVELVIPSTVKYLYKNLFANCAKLKKITLPNTIEYRDFAWTFNTLFNGCPVLESISFSGGEHADYSTQNGNLLSKDGTKLLFGMVNSPIPSKVTVIGKGAYDGRNIENITIPNSIVEIEEYAFYLCKKLSNITIPNSVTKVGDYVLGYCTNLTTITIGSGVTEIGSNALAYCENLKSINFQGSKAEWNAIIKGSNWNNKTGEYIVQCTDGKLDKTGKEIK